MIKGSNFSDGTWRMVGVARKWHVDKLGPCFCPFLQPFGKLVSVNLSLHMWEEKDVGRKMKYVALLMRHHSVVFMLKIMGICPCRKVFALIYQMLMTLYSDDML